MPQSAFPGARAGILGLALSQVLVGDIVPVSHLPAGHSCGEAGQQNTVPFMRRQKGERLLLEAPRMWLWAGYEGWGAQSISSPPLTVATGPQVGQGNPIRKISQ